MNLRAFTLLETLVAVAVLLMALLGPFSIAQQALKSAYYARDQVTAYYLAQEGIEFVRALRDQNYLAGNFGSAWLTPFDTTCTNAACTVDFPNFSYAACQQSGCPPLRISQTGGLFNHVTGDPSIFTRQVRLTTVPTNADEVIVSVTISWTSAGVPRVFTLQERLFNWL